MRRYRLMKRLTVPLIFLIFLISGCQSGTIISAGGYRMVHFNNPECMGSSAAGAMIVSEKTEDIVKANIGFKTGYCEAITGQVISTGGEVMGANLQRKGLADSGNETKVNTQTNQATGSPAPGGSAPN
jgi:hypothetical protein